MSRILQSAHYKKMAVLAFLLGVCMWGVQAQGTSKSWQLFYKPGPGKSGLTEVKVNFRAKVVNAMGTMMLTYEADCSGNLEYQYKNRTFLFSANDQPIRAVRPVNPYVAVVVELPGGVVKNYTLDVISGESGSALGANSVTLLFTAKTQQERNPANYVIRSAQVVDMGFENTAEVVSVIEDKLRREKLQIEVRSLTEEANRAENSGSLSKSVQSWERIRLLDPENQQALQALGRLKKKMGSAQNQTSYDNMMRSARKAEEEKNLPLAERIYNNAASLPVQNNQAAGESRRVRDLYDRQQRDLAETQKREAEAASRAQQDLKDQKEADRLAANKRLKEIAKDQENALREKNEEMARSLDRSERERVRKEFENSLRAAAADRARKEAQDNQRDQQVYQRMLSDDSLYVKKNSGVYGWDPVQYQEWVRKGDAYYQESFQIKPYEALELKRAWWDYSPHAQVYSDGLYEEQRRKNFQLYLNKLWQENRKLNEAKGAYLIALKYTAPGSTQYRIVMEKITALTNALNTTAVAIKYAPQGESNRIKYRDMHRSIDLANQQATDREKAALAVSMYKSNAAYPSTGASTEYELVERTREARAQAQSVEAAQGVVGSAVMGTFLDDSKEVRTDVRYGRFDFNVALGFMSHPILMNVTYPGGDPTTETASMVVEKNQVGASLWIVRGNNLNAAVGANLSLGLFPSVGSLSFYFDHIFHALVEVGFKPVKLTFSAERQRKMGTMGIDYDVYINNNTNGVSNSGKVSSGKFNYSTFKLGGGLKLFFDGTNDGPALQFKVYGEKPDFYPFSLLKQPVRSFGIEYHNSGMCIMIANGNNYVIPGEHQGPVSEAKKQSYFELRISKSWSL